MYKRLDDKYIKPCLLRENHFKDPKIIETYENLTERDALEFMKRNPTQFAELAGTKTMAELNAMVNGNFEFYYFLFIKKTNFDKNNLLFFRKYKHR